MQSPNNIKGDLQVIDFGLYCDIKNSIEQEVEARNCITSFACFCNENTDANQNEQAVYELLNNCDAQTIRCLMEYFDKDAPIQKLLEARMAEVEQQNADGDLNTYIENSLKDMVEFYPYLAELIKKKGFSSDADFYNYIGMSRQTFAKLRKKNAAISRNYALLMAVGLGLNYNEAVEFMGMAGFAFKRSNTRENIISYVMKNREYDLMEMEEILYSFGEKSLMDI